MNIVGVGFKEGTSVCPSDTRVVWLRTTSPFA